MGGSIHIHGTGSSIVDTVFVCRDLAEHQTAIPFDHLEAVIRIELSHLEAAGMRPTHGDIRCITYGHLTRLAILTLYPEWDGEATMPEKLSLFGRMLDGLGDHAQLITGLAGAPADLPAKINKNKKPKQPEIAPYAAAV